MPDNDENFDRPKDGGGQPTKSTDGQGGDEPIPLKSILLIAAASAAAAFGGAVAGVNSALGGG